VLEEFRKALSRDHTKMTVNGFTALGLVEMTRKRTRESLAHLLCEPCPTCGGRGEVKTARTMCYEILRELLREARQFNAREFRVLAAPNVIDLFLDEESQSLAMLSDFIGKTDLPAGRGQLHSGAVRHRAAVLVDPAAPDLPLRAGRGRRRRSALKPGAAKRERQRRQAFGRFVEEQQISRRGLVISARPIASICCSPPDSWLPRLRRARPGAGRARRRARVHGSRRHCAAREGHQVLVHREVREDCRPSGTSAIPRRAMRRALGRGSLAGEADLPPLPAQAQIVRIVVVLPMPLRPSSATTSPARCRRSRPNSTWLVP
jgi:hypothetical protein